MLTEKSTGRAVTQLQATQSTRLRQLAQPNAEGGTQVEKLSPRDSLNEFDGHRQQRLTFTYLFVSHR